MRLTNDSQYIKIIIKYEGSAERKISSKKIFERSNSKTVNFINMDSENISMPLVRSLIELHGGTLSVSFNDVEKSTSVICSLPINFNLEKSNEDENSSLEIFEKAVNS